MAGKMTQDQREAFLAAPRVAILAVPESGRGPVTVPVWYWYEPGGHLWFETEPTSRKGRLLELGTRISLCVQDDQPPYAYVSIEGPIVDIAHDDPELHELPMAMRYLGERAGREYVASLPAGEWQRYIVRPERWRSFDGASGEE